ncbi:MAG: hypothetical protein ABJH82_02185 [Polaribacter sp.]|uniref:hypothetical protein n=1 Tax=Polaribacter sp. TaxID=1920175 RepID=UPI003264B5EC
MKIEKKDTFTLITSDENSFTELYNSFLTKEKNLEKENIVVQNSKNINVSTKEFLLFLNIAEQKKQNGTSFVIVSSDIDMDNFPDNFNIVPTLQEAKDVIEMENIERDLGF